MIELSFASLKFLVSKSTNTTSLLWAQMVCGTDLETWKQQKSSRISDRRVSKANNG